MYFLGLDFILFFFICKGQFLKVCSKESWSFLWQGGRRVRWTLFVISFPFGGVSGRIFVCAEADILSQCNCGLSPLGRSRFEIFWLKPWGLFFSPNLFHLCAAVLHFCPSLVEIECSPYLTSAQEWDFVLWPVLAETSIWCPCHRFHREAGDCMIFSTELQWPAKLPAEVFGSAGLAKDLGDRKSYSFFFPFLSLFLQMLSKFISIWLLNICNHRKSQQYLQRKVSLSCCILYNLLL